MDIIVNNGIENRYDMDRNFTKENTDIIYLTF